ncbi:SDR family NAD(P)-dependent oxidoreductase [Egicoccus sp. AB-alg2]|uniref:SDR family NAD(P)-dependent oxidoreductase n=1 Tax=Egicoccus sp. AB-alg2 TaxID=3242693 RepID=UPI00359D88B9
MAGEDARRVALVTGATSGIGRATAERLHADGWSVVATGQDDRRADEIAAVLRDRGHVARVDLAASDAATRLVAATVERFGRLDALVNNAGVHTLATAVETDDATWDRVLGINLRAAFQLAREAIPVMARGGGGTIVNVASEAGLVAVPGQVAYNVSKAGMVMLTRSLAIDHADQGIRAVSVCPGTTETPLVREAIDAAPDPAAHARTLAASRPAKRLGRVEEIAAAIAFTVGGEVGFLTGSELVIDGGYTAR